jgi:hypothetical protein
MLKFGLLLVVTSVAFAAQSAFHLNFEFCDPKSNHNSIQIVRSTRTGQSKSLAVDIVPDVCSIDHVNGHRKY